MGRPRKAANGKGDSEWIRERLLDAAEHLFARKGYDATGLRDIGLRVGVSNATLLHHFGSKLALYRAVLVRLALALRALVDSVATSPDDDPLPALRRFLERFTSWTRENPNYGLIAFREFMDKTVRESHLDVRLEADVLRRLAEIVRRGQRRGVFRDVDVDAFVVQLLGTVWLGEIANETMAMIFERETDDFGPAFRDQALATLLRGLVVDGARRAATRPSAVGALH